MYWSFSIEATGDHSAFANSRGSRTLHLKYANEEDSSWASALLNGRKFVIERLP